jgi:uncharacterized membrane protein YtjA (UPF0391 family)
VQYQAFVNGGSLGPQTLCVAAAAWPCRSGSSERIAMLYYAVIFFLIALVAALFGFGGIAAGAAGIAKILFFVFALLACVSLVAGVFRRG